MSQEKPNAWPVSLAKETGTRRDMFKAVAVAIAGTAGCDLSESYAQTVPPDVEGIFLVSEKDDRIFFIRSAWLSFFEVTDSYTDADKLEKALAKGRNAAHIKDKWNVLYSDGVATDPIANSQDLASPMPGKIYIAMSMSGT